MSHPSHLTRGGNRAGMPLLSSGSGGSSSSNATEMLTDIPAAMLESFLPGFGILSRVLETSLGLDITSVVSTCFIIAALLGAISYSWRRLYALWASWFTSTVTIHSNDALFEQLLHWLAAQPSTRNNRALTASTSTAVADDSRAVKAFKETGKYDFARLHATTPPEYSPSPGNHRLWHKGRLFLLRREIKKEQPTIMQNAGSARADDRQVMSITCLGRSTEPIKDVIMESKRFGARLNRAKTQINSAALGQYGRWTKSTTRPSRPLETVYMDETLRDELLQDLRDYLDPAAPKFYAQRGIPYRRGYLFHGPPGTGKTSLTFALAGLFGFELHVASLKEPYMSESKLSQLFASLPTRCIVLLEDVDAAGLEKREDAKDTADQKTQQPASGGRRMGMPPPADGITLSGLLNAIDGVASQEGRILIMTTNDPESLDKALIRPGRVDMQIYFGYASKKDAREIFLRMFSDDIETDEDGVADPEKQPEFPPALRDMADRFADIVPDKVFTPAECQGFLLTKRKGPQAALDAAVAWRDTLLAVKESGSNVIPSTADSAVAVE